MEEDWNFKQDDEEGSWGRQTEQRFEGERVRGDPAAYLRGEPFGENSSCRERQGSHQNGAQEVVETI